MFKSCQKSSYTRQQRGNGGDTLASPTALARGGVRVGGTSAKPYHCAHFLADVSDPGVCPVGSGPSRNHWASQSESQRKKMTRERGLSGTYPSLLS